MVQLLSLLLLLPAVVLLTSGAETYSDLVAAESVATDSRAQSVAGGSAAKYGYPYLIAPTLGPRIQARSDDDNEASQAKSYGSRTGIVSDEDIVVKKNSLKKSKIPYTYGAIRRQDGEDVSAEIPFRSYREPKYRNFEELEASFQPRRMDLDAPYSQYDYSKFAPKPSHSPRDPFLSPNDEPVDSFYPTSPKVKSYSSSSGYGTRNQETPSYGAGNYEDLIHYHDDSIHDGGSSYGGPSSSYSSSGGSSPSYPSSGGSPSYPLSGGSSPSYPSSGGSSPSYPLSGESSPSYPSSGGSYGYQDYEIKSNEPITGNIRKKLLDYAGASDLYEGEPDYLQEISRNKYKYGNIGNDYYAYGGPGYRDSYRDFPYVESKMSLIKKSRRV